MSATNVIHVSSYWKAPVLRLNWKSNQKYIAFWEEIIYSITCVNH